MSYRVVALGTVNAGKSALLSALAGRYGLFESGDVPGVTSKVQCEEIGSLALADTPGIDADESEEHLALAEARTADTVLWCHSLRCGELRPTELAALARYSRHSSLLWRTCFVLTHRDEVDGEADLKLVTATIAGQLSKVFGLPFGDPSPATTAVATRRPRPFDYVGTRVYWKAKAAAGRRRDLLERRSGIVRLREFLESLAARRKERSHG